jgi:hypothetical protein
MNEHDVFIAAGPPADLVRAVIEACLGTAFRPGQTPDPVPFLITASTKVFFSEGHPFEDDTDFPVSRYHYWINVHDAARNTERQLAIASQIFDAASAQGWAAMLSYGTQGNIAMCP